MRKLPIVMSTLILCIMGCASNKVWVNPSKSAEEAQKDYRECEYDANKSSYTPFGDGRSPISAGVQEGFQSVSLMRNCMVSRGYSLVDRTEHSQKINYNNDAMKSISEAFKNSQYEQVVSIANTYLEGSPYNANAVMYRAWAFHMLNKFDAAIIDYENVITILKGKTDANSNKTRMMAMSGKAVALADSGEFDIAIELVNICIDSDKTQAASYNDRAYVLNKKGEYDKAIEDCNKAIALSSTIAPPYKNRGIAYMGKGQLEKAITNFNKSIALDSTYGKAYFSRGDAYSKLGNIEKATLDYKKACELKNIDACAKISKETPSPLVVNTVIVESAKTSVSSNQAKTDGTPESQTINALPKRITASEVPSLLNFKKGVSFDHSTHGTDCVSCHTDGSTGKIPGFGKDYGHEQCRACHKSSRGPTNCKGCHRG